MKLICGNKAVVSLLEDALAQAKSGDLVGVVICGITDRGCGWTGAHREDIEYPWPRLQAAVDTAQQELLRDGTVDWCK